MKKVKKYMLKGESKNMIVGNGGIYHIKKSDVVAKLTNRILFDDKFQVIGVGIIGTISKYDIKHHFKQVE